MFSFCITRFFLYVKRGIWILLVFLLRQMVCLIIRWNRARRKFMYSSHSPATVKSFPKFTICPTGLIFSMHACTKRIHVIKHVCIVQVYDDTHTTKESGVQNVTRLNAKPELAYGRVRALAHAVKHARERSMCGGTQTRRCIESMSIMQLTARANWILTLSICRLELRLDYRRRCELHFRSTESFAFQNSIFLLNPSSFL